MTLLLIAAFVVVGSSLMDSVNDAMSRSLTGSIAEAARRLHTRG